MTIQSIDINDQIADQIIATDNDPAAHIQFAYDWGYGALSKYTGLRTWQRDICQDIKAHLTSDKRLQPLQIAVASGHDIGKSALISMIIKWAMDTHVDCRGIITANTEGQLRTKTAPELAKWNRLSITNDWFDVSATKISAIGQSSQNWRMDLIPWSENNPDAFGGLHNHGKFILLVMDEASGIADCIWETIEGVLLDEDTQIIWLAFGNPLRNSGRFRECWRKHKRQWKTYNIDSRDVEGTNKEKIKELAEAYGEDSDQFRTRVRGLFPNTSSRQFYETKLIEAAQQRTLETKQYDFAPTILSCDPAWTGDDDLVIGKRQGLDFTVLFTASINDDDVVIAQRLFDYQKQYGAQMVNIDQGYGTGIYSAGKNMGGTNWNLIPFGGASSRNDCINKRAEMLVEIRTWLKEGGSIDPDDIDLYEELIAVETAPDLANGRYNFPPKETMKKTLGRSPNRVDALGLTFAMPVNPAQEEIMIPSGVDLSW